jgi:aminoglycoside phosphotransferase (APT) family kinase protein
LGGALEKTLAENYMNKIWNLFNESYVADLFTREVLPHYPAFTAISRIEIKPYKKLIWETTYHVVIGFNTYFWKPSGEEDKIPIVCSAHSEEPRENIYQALKYLQSVDFPTAFIDIPDPLFYADYFRGTFYRGLKGQDLLHYIKAQDFTTVRRIVILTAQLFARLHAMPAPASANFNPLGSRISTVIPGVPNILREMAARYNGKYQADLSQIYDCLVKQEEAYFNAGGKAALIHGDAHPENILVTAPDRLGLIDFADMCLSDPLRDVGSFLQQLEYKIIGKADDPALAAAMKQLFLETYLSAAGLELDPARQERIDLYYNWTAMRTAIFWFLKFGHNEERAEALLHQVKNNLHI